MSSAPADPSPRRWALPAAEILSVGLPFCVFKCLTGAILLRVGALAPLGAALVALGTIDLALNVLNLGGWLLLRRRLTGVCLAEIALARRERGGAELGLAVDVLLSFALVAVVVGLGLLSELPPEAVAAWNLAVVLNVIGAGIGRVLAALPRRD